MNKLIELQYSGIIEERGIELAKKHCFKYTLPIEMSNNQYMVMAEYKDYSITICFYYNQASSTTKLAYADCSCPHNVEVCKHIIGAYYDYADNVFEDEINYQVGRGNAGELAPKQPSLIELLIGNTIFEQLESTSSNKYELIPEFVEEGATLGIKLKIGIIGGKSFVVKNIYDLPDLFFEKSTTIYGQSTEIVHDLNQFEDKEFIRSLLEDISIAAATISGVSAKESRDWYGYYSSSDIRYDKKTLSLTHEQVTKLFSLLAGDKIKYSRYNLQSGQYTIAKCKNKIEFDVQPIDENQVELILKLELNRVISADNKLVMISHDNKEINIYEYPDEKIQFIISNLIANKLILDSSTAYNFEHSVLSRIDQFVTINGDFSYLYNDVTIYDLQTTLVLQGEQLHIDSRIVDENGEEINDYSNENIVLESWIQASMLGEKYVDDGENTLQYMINGVNNIIDFINNEMETIENFSDVIKSNEAFKNFKLIKRVKVTTSISQNGNSTILKFESSEFSDSELLTILKSFELNEDYIALEDGKIVDLKSEDINKLVTNCNQLELDIANSKKLEFEIDKASIFYLNTVFENIEAVRSNDSIVEAMVAEYNQVEQITNHKFPKINAELRDYQRVGVNWLNFLHNHNFGGILADDMGLGKTLQVICQLSTLDNTKPSIIITPASLIYNWQHEYTKFCPTQEVIVMDGTKAERAQLITKVKGDVVCIVSYDSFKRDIDLFTPIEFNYGILDEAQHIKNQATKISKSVKALNTEHRLALTGTPIENNLNDLWSLFDFIIPGYLGSIKKFRSQYITPIENGDKIKQQALKNKIEPFIMRRLKSQVLTELPAKTEKVIRIKMETDQQKIYDATALQVKKFIEDTSDEEMNKKQIEILAMITKMRQIACNPSLTNANYAGSVAKTEYLLETLDTLIANGRKVVIFSQFVSNFDHLESEFANRGYDNYKITGSTPKGKRHGLVEKFNKNDVPIFLISLKAGGTGLNITGADTVIHFDPWWNTAVENQATDRVHRMGQKNNVLVYKLICERTIEEQIELLQASKRTLAESLLEADEVKSTKLTKEELISLFD